jgi:hypothetical protein
MGCGRLVTVCSLETLRCVKSKVMDAGPFGIYRGKLKNCKPEGRWRRWTRSTRAPKGWKFRAVADLSWGLWKQLGKPRFLSYVYLFFHGDSADDYKMLTHSVCTSFGGSATI